MIEAKARGECASGRKEAGYRDWERLFIELGSANVGPSGEKTDFE